MLRFLLILCLAHFAVGDTVTGQIYLVGDGLSSANSLTGCTLTVEIRDTSVADGAAPLLGSNQDSTIASFPIPYVVTYTPQNPPKPAYSINARIQCSAGGFYFNDVATRISPNEDDSTTADINVRRFS